MALPRTTVNHTLIDPTADPIQRAGTIVLGGFVGRQWRDIQGMSTDGQIISALQVDADINGDWSVDLIANSDVANPANTLYRYLPAAGDPVVFEVKTGGPFQLAELVITDPAQWPGLVPTTIGPTGPANTLHEGTATTGAPGTDMSFSITGTPPNQTLSLTIPRGDEGEAATVDVDPNPVTGAPGTNVGVANTGDTHAAIFKFTIPRGNTGAALEYDWNGTELGVRVEGDASYQYVDLEGPTGPVGLTWQGDWSSAGVYVPGDGVAHNGSSYLCIANRSATATAPPDDPTHWAVLSQRGVDGAVQPSGPITINNVWGGTQSEYDAIVTPDPNTLYVVVPDPEVP